jgi:glucosamine--fructose-6-phosphate aminotransferase (isomerizing)
MCGIFGLIALNPRAVGIRHLRDAIKKLFQLSETRGKDAAGIAALSGDITLVAKGAVTASTFVRSASFKRVFDHLDAQNTMADDIARRFSCAIIGHSRMVTNGSQLVKANNQPIIAEGVVGIHNGIILNVKLLWHQHSNLIRSAEVDSEIIFALLSSFLSNGDSTGLAISMVFREIKGTAAIAALLPERNQLVIATNHGSLYFAISTGFGIAFASERPMLASFVGNKGKGQFFSGTAPEIERVLPGQAAVFDIGTLELTTIDSTTSNDERHRAAVLFHDRGIVEVEDASETLDPAPRLAHPTPGRISTQLLESAAANDLHYSKSLRRCTRCILPQTMPFIRFDEEGVCSYCHSYRKNEVRGTAALIQLAQATRRPGLDFDCIVALSGGRDSCYTLHYAVKVLGLRPIAYTYDWGMVTDLARRNISRMCSILKVEHVVISADIAAKRSFVKANVLAWLKRPDLGMIPLFMSGDKAFFYHGNRLKRQYGIDTLFMGENLLEKTSFKTGFAGISPEFGSHERNYTLSTFKKLKLASFYLKNFITNPAYINSSLVDTTIAYSIYYLMRREYVNLFGYLVWDEEEILRVLRNEYDWETAPDTDATWRIGDGTAAFYNFIYFHLVGFTENDTFRSNQIREGLLTRAEALRRVSMENRPRWSAIEWYFDTIGISFGESVRRISETPRAESYLQQDWA